MTKKFFTPLFKIIFVAAFWLLIWVVAAKKVGIELLLPSPLQVFNRLCELVFEKDFFVFTGMSLLRILSGILIATIAGILISVITHTSGIMRALISPMLSVIKATPVASFILLALVWLNRDILPIFISLLIVLPVVWSNVSEGLCRVDRRLLEMAKVFNLGIFSTIKNIYIPSVLPFFNSAFRTSIGLAWKAGIAAEVLAVPARSIGKKLYESKAYFETTDLFAWTVIVIILSLLIEIIFGHLLSKTLKRERR